MTKSEIDKRYADTDKGKATRRDAQKKYEASLRGWCMKQCRRIRYRCERRFAKEYHRYGGRGIRLEFTGPELECWITKHQFEWTGRQIHRIDNDGSYCLSNIVLLLPEQHRAVHNDDCPI